jgi:hypothetical protein
MAGLPKPARKAAKLPAKGTTERKAYDTAMRALQRASRAGQINPRTGKAYQTRAGKARIEKAIEAIRTERRLGRRKSVTLKITAVVMINGDPRYMRRRTMPDVTLSGAGYRKIADGDPEALDALADHLGEESGLASAPGVADFDIFEIEVTPA